MFFFVCLFFSHYVLTAESFQYFMSIMPDVNVELRGKNKGFSLTGRKRNIQRGCSS